MDHHLTENHYKNSSLAEYHSDRETQQNCDDIPCDEDRIENNPIDERTNTQYSDNFTIYQDLPFLTEQKAKQIYSEFVDSNSCYNRDPLKNMKIKNLVSSYTYIYILETLIETRETIWKSEPYEGPKIADTISSTENIWDIPCDLDITFLNREIQLKVLNDAYVKDCDSCDGSGYIDCSAKDCQKGRITCSDCNGRGVSGPDSIRCETCDAEGDLKCPNCDGSGKQNCDKCDTNGKIKWYKELTVKHKVIRDDYLKKSENIHDDLLRNCASSTRFKESSYNLYPIDCNIDKDINSASKNLIDNHKTMNHDRRLIYQRHKIESIPITVCNYEYKQKLYKFYVYGEDNKVYDPYYPVQSCCTCTAI